MESFFQSSQSRFGSSWNFNAFKNLSEISPAVQSHLKQVFYSLSSFPWNLVFNLLIDLKLGLDFVLF